MAGDSSGVVKLHAPELFAVVAPSLTPSVLNKVTVEFATAVPVRVTESLELTAVLVMTGAATGKLLEAVFVAAGSVKPAVPDFVVAAGTVTAIPMARPLVPPDVVSVAVYA